MTDVTPKPHILAINNEPSVLDLFRELLQEEGYRVSTREYVDKNMDTLVALNPDLIIMDYMWAGDDSGWSLLQMLRMHPETAKIPIVVCTGAKREMEDLGDHLLGMGIRVVLKPFELDSLLEAIARGLGQDSDSSGDRDGREK